MTICRFCDEEIEKYDGDWCYLHNWDTTPVHYECAEIYHNKIDMFLSRCCENCANHSVELVQYGSWGGGDSYYEIKCKFINKTFPFSKSRLNCDKFGYLFRDI